MQRRTGRGSAKQAWPRLYAGPCPASPRCLPARFERQAQRTRLYRVEMPVGDGRGFTGELALVEISDVVVARVEQVVGGESDRESLADAAAHLEVHDGGRIGTHRVVFDQGRSAEVPEPRAAKPAARVLHGDADRRDAFDRARNVI